MGECRSSKNPSGGPKGGGGRGGSNLSGSNSPRGPCPLGLGNGLVGANASEKNFSDPLESHANVKRVNRLSSSSRKKRTTGAACLSGR